MLITRQLDKTKPPLYLKKCTFHKKINLPKIKRLFITFQSHKFGLNQLKMDNLKLSY